MSGSKKVLLGMIIIAISGLMVGASIGYLGMQLFLNKQVFKTMTAEGYILTKDATATQQDIISGKTAFVNGVSIEGTMSKGLDVSDATATANDIVRGKTAYTSNDGSITTGNMPVYTGDTVINPTTTTIYIQTGYYLNEDITIKGSRYLVPANIKNGMSIFKVVGTFTNQVVEPEVEEGTGE